MLSLASPYPFFTDKAGDPLDGGYIYVGEVNQNPETAPVVAYWDEAGTQPAAQPLRTLAGYIVRNGTPARAYVDGDDFSMTVKDKRGVVLFYDRSVAAASGVRDDLLDPLDPTKNAGMIGFNPALNYAVGTLGARLAGDINPKDFPWLAKGDGVSDDAAAINACMAWGSSAGGARMIVDIGDYRCASQLLLKPGVDIIGKRRGSWDAGDPGVQFIKDFASGSLMYSPGTQTLSGCLYEDFWIHGHKEVVGYTGCGIEIQRALTCTFRRVWVRDAPSHGFLIGLGDAQDYHNYLYNCYAFFNGGDGFNIKSDWARLIDCWADGNKSGVNISGGSFPFIERFHAEEFEDAGIRLSGTNGITSINATIRDPILFSRPYSTAWRSAGIWIAGGAAGAQVLIENPKITFQPSYAALGTQAAYEFESGVLDITIRDGVETGFSTSIRHANANRINLVENTFNSPFALLSSMGDLYIERNRLTSTVSIAATSVTAVGNTGYANNSDWTPAPTFGGGSTGLTGAFAGKYTQNGKQVFIDAVLTFTAKGSSTGVLEISGLPIPSNAKFQMFVAMVSNTSGVTGPVWGYLNATNGKIYLSQGVATALTDANVSNNSVIHLSFFYTVT